MVIRIAYVTRIVGLTGAVLALGAGAAPARPVALWGCHGPLGQPLGGAGLAADSAGDGATAAGATACTGAAGLVATFSRADPAGGSTAAWRADVPAQTTLRGARATRTITPATAPYANGVPQRYLVRSSSATIESINLLDVWATPPATVAGAAGGGSVVAGVDCPRPATERCGAAAPGTLSLGALALDVDDALPPRGSVAGLRNPVRGILGLQVDAVDDGVGLATARATVDGATRGEIALDERCADLDPATPTPDVPLAGCARRVSGVALPVSFDGLAVGAHRLDVRVVDGAGNEALVYAGDVAVGGADPVMSPSVTLTIGDPRSGSSPVTGASAPVAPGAVPTCPAPRLSMALDQRPLRLSRTRPARPVLRAGGRYRFRGWLTCRVGTMRRSAPRGVPVELLNRVGRRTFAVTGATTMTDGRLTMILAYRTSRTLIFRHRTSTGTSQVRIAISIVKQKAIKKKKARR